MIPKDTRPQKYGFFNGETLWYNVVATQTNAKGFMMEITVKYQSHNGTGFNTTDSMEYLPRVGEMIFNNSLKDSGCTGTFVIHDITHERADDGSFSCVVQCIEFGDVDDKRDRLAESGHLPYQ